MSERCVAAEPYPAPMRGDLCPANTALAIIDMQRDFAALAAMSIAGLRPLFDPRADRADRSYFACHAPFQVLHFPHTHGGHRPDPVLSIAPRDRRPIRDFRARLSLAHRRVAAAPMRR
jgi:hypothetical protein